MSVPLCDDVHGTPTTCSPGSPGRREVDEATALQTLYLLDRFGVSDEFYHELTQVRYKRTPCNFYFIIHVQCRFTHLCNEAMW